MSDDELIELADLALANADKLWRKWWRRTESVAWGDFSRALRAIAHRQRG